MRKILSLLYLSTILTMVWSCTETSQESKHPVDGSKIQITKVELADKVKGGWAGQVIGCTYGGFTEFRFKGTMIQDYQPVLWNDTLPYWWYTNSPGLYDDVYMDLTFVDVFERLGLDAPVDSHAMAFAKAEYVLWHANQAARYNILQGIMPPQSGYWKNSPHADDIDFQIEADYAGLMAPGLPNAAIFFSDSIGHIMNYGDGWYGGVYVATMYSLAFISDDVEFIVTEALKAIPEKSGFYQCMKGVIDDYQNDPQDWKKAWFNVERNWSSDIGCPDGVFDAFNIDATVNSAYIIIGLLYGQCDYTRTLDISMRCGQDSDCNPASAGGILGTMLGYSRIPDMWKKPLNRVEDMDFKYTTMSLNDVYSIGLRHGLQVIEKSGAATSDSIITIIYEAPKTVRYEKSFEGLMPIYKADFGYNNLPIGESKEFDFEGSGIVIRGGFKDEWSLQTDFVQLIEIAIDNQIVDTALLPASFVKRKHDIYWNYDMAEKKHNIKLKPLNVAPGVIPTLTGYIVYQKEKQIN